MGARRFTAGERHDINGVAIRVREGNKFTGDLVMEQWNGREWRRVMMEHALLMTAFLAENERERRNHMSFWKENGDTFFLKHVIAAVREGWQPVAARIAASRRPR